MGQDGLGATAHTVHALSSECFQFWVHSMLSACRIQCIQCTVLDNAGPAQLAFNAQCRTVPELPSALNAQCIQFRTGIKNS